jgi:hypothetical protein
MKLVESCELKQSIPGEIVLLRHTQTGQVVVAYKEDSYLNDGSYVNIFDRIYSSNSSSTTSGLPYFAPQENIPEIRDRAYATEASGRLPLVLSEMIKDEIKSFKIKSSVISLSNFLASSMACKVGSFINTIATVSVM